jgi:hypothetical protein
MLKTLLGIFLILNSILGYGFYEDTAFGDFLAQSELLGLSFIVINFIVSHVLVIALKVPGLEWMSILLLKALFALFLLGVGFYIPYLVIFEWFGWSGLFAMVVFLLGVIFLLSVILAPLMRSLLENMKQMTDAFFDGLKRGAIDNALAEARKTPYQPLPLVKKMSELNKLSKDLDKMLEDDHTDDKGNTRKSN